MRDTVDNPGFPPVTPQDLKATAGQAVSRSPDDQPPVVKRAELIAISLVSLLIITSIVVLYVAKAFFLPIVTAFIVGTMLAPAAGYLERRKIPRAISAVLIVALTGIGVSFMVGLITAPLMEWSTRLPELGGIVKEKMQLFDRPLALWRQLQTMLGGQESSGASLQLPKIEWMQPTLEFLSPTFTEFLLFLATLVLFIAAWPDLRRKAVMTFADHDARLRTLRILNSIETSLGSYLIMVTMINGGVGIATGLICWAAGMPNPAGLGALAATLNFFPIIGPVAMFIILTAVGVIAFPTLSAGLVAPAGFVIMTFMEGHFITPAIIGRRLQLNALAVFLALAFWTWLWGPMGGFLASPILIVGLVLKEHLHPDTSPQLP
jgi:predicted PurR-regulated permease PerM